MAVIALAALLAGCGQAPPPDDEPVRLPASLKAEDYPPRGWTWAPVPGLQGAQAHRYGVGSPSTTMRAQVVIVPARAPAQAWFGVANRLIDRGYGVWLLDPLPSPAEPAAVRGLIDQAVRPGENRRLVVLGEAEGAQAAVAAGGKADLMILWSPKLTVPEDGLSGWAVKLGLGGLRDPKFHEWRQGEPANDRIAAAWMQDNPALRPTAPSFEQKASVRRIALEAQPAWAGIKGAVRINGGDAAATAFCAKLKACTPIGPGADAVIEALDALTAKDTPSAPPVVKRAKAP
jgi:hypothetical protein